MSTYVLPRLNSDVCDLTTQIFQEKQCRRPREGSAGHAPGSAELWPPGPRHVLPVWEDLQGHLLGLRLQRWHQPRQRHWVVNPPMLVSSTSISAKSRNAEAKDPGLVPMNVCLPACLSGSSGGKGVNVIREFPDAFSWKETIRNRFLHWWHSSHKFTHL